MCFSKLYLHMATHGYTCVNPVLVLFYTCSFVFFQFYTCVTPFFGGFTHGYTWLHMATHPLHIWENFQDRQLYGLRFCHSLGGRGLNVRHLIQINPSNWPFKTSQKRFFCRQVSCMIIFYRWGWIRTKMMCTFWLQECHLFGFQNS